VASATGCGEPSISTVLFWTILVQDRRDQVAAERFLRRVPDAEDAAGPRVVITDKLASYPPAIRRALPRSEHRRHKAAEQSC